MHDKLLFYEAKKNWFNIFFTLILFLRFLIASKLRKKNYWNFLFFN